MNHRRVALSSRVALYNRPSSNIVQHSSILAYTRRLTECNTNMNRVHLNKRRPAGGRARTSATERSRAQPSADERGRARGGPLVPITIYRSRRNRPFVFTATTTRIFCRRPSRTRARREPVRARQFGSPNSWALISKLSITYRIPPHSTERQSLSHACTRCQRKSIAPRLSGIAFRAATFF